MPIDEQSFIITTLERINTKLDKHDDKIDMIVTAMQQLVKVDTENKEIKESLKRVFERLEEVEDNQSNDGCPAHKNFVKVREEQLKGYDKLAIDCKEMHNKLLVRIETIEEKPKKRLEVAVVEVIKWATIIILGIVGVKIGLTK